MRPLIFILVFTVCSRGYAGEVAPPANARADELIRSLNLQFLDGESGYFAVIGKSPQRIDSGGRAMSAQSQIYYLLTSEHPINYLHWLASADTHVLIEGGPVDYYLFYPDGRAERLTLGRDVAAGQRPVIAVPPGCWKALRLQPGAPYALMANALSPEWTPDRVKIGADSAWIQTHAGRAPWADPGALRALVGPNFRP